MPISIALNMLMHRGDRLPTERGSFLGHKADELLPLIFTELIEELILKTQTELSLQTHPSSPRTHRAPTEDPPTHTPNQTG